MKIEDLNVQLDKAMKNKKLLTIAIPTFNRANCLSLLLNSISEQYSEVKDSVQVIVVNNASTDDTEDQCFRWMKQIKYLKYIKNDSNIGGNPNITKCFDIVVSPYCWIIGDDDIIQIGALKQIVEFLKKNKPDIVCMNNSGFVSKPASTDINLIGRITPWLVDKIDFARIVNVRATFISAIIVNKDKFLESQNSDAFKRFIDTDFPQLAWVLGNLTTGTSFIYIPQKLILARSGASGGYNFYRAFSVVFNNIIDAALDSKTGNIIKRRTLLSFMPSTLLMSRKNKIGNFNLIRDDENFIKVAYGKYFYYYLLILPILSFPLPVAAIFLFAARIISKAHFIIDRLRILAKTLLHA